ADHGSSRPESCVGGFKSESDSGISGPHATGFQPHDREDADAPGIGTPFRTAAADGRHGVVACGLRYDGAEAEERRGSRPAAPCAPSRGTPTVPEGRWRGP